MKKKSLCTIRVMRKDELEKVLGWADGEGWNPGLADAEILYEADPEGFLAGEIDGELVSSISAVRLDGWFAFLGLYMVRPEFRARGCGHEIWHEACVRTSGRMLGFNQLLAGEDLCRKAGFQTHFYQTRLRGNAGEIAQIWKSRRNPENCRIVPLSSIPFDKIEDYDRLHFELKRTRFLKNLLAAPGVHAAAALDTSGGHLTGYALLRPARHGYRLGPLVANTPRIAEALLAECAKKVEPAAEIFLDAPNPNEAVRKWADRYGLTEEFQSARMYASGSELPLPFWRIFSTATLELG